MPLHSKDIATASAVATVVGRLVGSPTSRVVAQLLRGERPTARDVSPQQMDELLEILSRPGYLDGSPDDLTDAAASLGRACGLNASVGRRRLQRGLSVGHAATRVFLKTGDDRAVLEGPDGSDRREVAVRVPWRPWEALDAIAGLLDVELPSGVDGGPGGIQQQLEQLQDDVDLLRTGSRATFFSDEAYALVVQFGDMIGRLAAITAELPPGDQGRDQAGS